MITPFREILEESQAFLQSYLQENHLEAYRLYNYSHPEYRVFIDICKTAAVIHILDESALAHQKEIEKALQQTHQIKKFFYKNRTKQVMKVPSSPPGQTMVVEEYGHKFFLNLSDYLDTGLFLDHRETRRWIGAQSKGKRVLNTFAYTGSFSVYAAANGALHTYSVDLSRTYTEWIKKNFEINQLPLEQNYVYKMDTLEFFRYAKRKQLQFDIIIIDPPSFSKNKKKNFSVQRDHPLLINAALEILNPNGFILFSNNKQDFVLYKSKLTPCEVLEKTDTIPVDYESSKPHNCYIITKK